MSSFSPSSLLLESKFLPKITSICSYWVRLSLKTQYPSDLIKLIFKFWNSTDDIFDTKVIGAFITLDDNNTASCEDNIPTPWNLILGLKKFSSGKHSWTYKLIELPNSGAWGNGCIGITKCDTARNKVNEGFDGYGFSPGHGRYSNENRGLLFCPPFSPFKDYGPVCKKGDIIQMFVDLDKRKLWFKVNKIEYKNGFKEGEIEPNQYRMALCFDNSKCKIQLL